MNYYKTDSRLGLTRIQSLDYSNNNKTIKVYSRMIIVDKRLKCKDMKLKII